MGLPEVGHVMTGTTQRPNVNSVLHILKDFQRDTVDYVYRRMYSDEDQTRRFLVADEVGLGKTLVARGLIARAIDYLWDDVERIDVVYICSNAEIARQNIKRLNVGADEFALASRITLLPLKIGNLKKNKINFVSFTPGTSFNLRSKTGVMDERALLYWLLDPLWGLRGRMGPLNVLQDEAGAQRFRDLVSDFPLNTIDCALAEAFRQRVSQLDQAENLRQRFEDLCFRFRRRRIHIPDIDRQERREFIGLLRRILAQTCLEALEPDLVILDEFQRFKSLLNGQDQASELAKQLFDYADEVSSARVLLLSATPYKMMSLSSEERQEDHYSDFIDTMKFLHHDEVNTEAVAALLNEFRQSLYRLGGEEQDAIERLRHIKSELEAQLHKVMVRTERLAVSEDRNGMLAQVEPANMRLESTDVDAFVELQELSRLLDQGDLLEYWKSAPYLLNFMEGYKLKEALNNAREQPGYASHLARAIDESRTSLFPIDEWRTYQSVAPANSRLRQIQSEMIESGLWRLLWIPSSLPYHQLGGVYRDFDHMKVTKRLIFSCWVVAPKTIAAMLSYEAERNMMRSFDEAPENSTEARRRIRALLRFTRAEGRLTGMPVFALLYPSTELARHLDPLQIARSLQSTANTSEVHAIERVLEEAKSRVHALLANLPSGDESGPEDEAWYWAAPLLLDSWADGAATGDWLDQISKGNIGEESNPDDEDQDDKTGWSDHVAHAKSLVEGKVQLGRRPADLEEVIARLGIAGPGVASLRCLLRRDPEHIDSGIRSAALNVARGFRSLLTFLK